MTLKRCCPWGQPHKLFRKLPLKMATVWTWSKATTVATQEKKYWTKKLIYKSIDIFFGTIPLIFSRLFQI